MAQGQPPKTASGTPGGNAGLQRTLRRQQYRQEYRQEHRQSAPVTTAEGLIAAPGGQLRSARFGDIYFSNENGAAESAHVFVTGNELPSRWQQLHAGGCRQSFAIGELGFGTGLNFLVTLDTWLRCRVSAANAGAKASLYYYATEAWPLTRKALRKALDAYDPFPELSAALLAQYPDIVGSDYLLKFEFEGSEVFLVLLLGESGSALDRLEHYHPAESPNAVGTQPCAQTIDAWYLDGFAPKCNPAMWQQSLLCKIARHSSAGTTAATFSVAREVRENLAACGFDWQRRAGYGRKRDMLTAIFKGAACKTKGAACNTKQVDCTSNDAVTESRQPISGIAKSQLHNNAYSRNRTNTSTTTATDAIVIGAGIAGCSSAAALASKGFRVTVLDGAAGGPATGASGNRAAILYARTALQQSAHANWHEAAFHYACHFYRRLGCGDQLAGMLRLGEQLDAAWLDRHPELEYRQNTSADAASEIAGCAIQDNGIFYAQAGVLDPRLICTTLLEQTGIQGKFGTRATVLQKSAGRWLVTLDDGSALQARLVVIACAEASRTFAQTRWLPLASMRGQTTHLPAGVASAQLRIPLCGRGYITPAVNGLHECGASYSKDTGTTHCCEADHLDNREKALALLPSLSQAQELSSDSTTLQGRVAMRCATPDYLPLLGPVVDSEAFFHDFAPLARNARQLCPGKQCPVEEGLFVNCGYGSHGFTSAPLLSELLASYATGRPFPVADPLRRAVHPVRFLLRELIRGKPPAYRRA